MAFDPAAYAATLAPAPDAPSGGFDPAAYAASLVAPAPAPSAPPAEQYKFDETPKEDEPGLLESVARGAKQGVTLGLGDELTGAVESLLTSKTYQQARDEARANDAAAKRAHRWGFGLGEVVGGLAAPVPGGGLGNIAKGAVTGGIAALGNSEADLTKGDIGGAAKDVAWGAGLGGAIGGVAGAASEKLVQGAEGRVAARAANESGKAGKAFDMALMFHNPAAFAGKKLGGAALRGGDEILAKIAEARASGSPMAALVQNAIQAGIPRATIAAAVTGGEE